MPFPELLVIVSSAVPHFFPPSSQVFPAFHEKLMPPVVTELDALPEFEELDVPDVLEELPVLDTLEELPELGTLEELSELNVPEEPPVLEELGGIS